MNLTISLAQMHIQFGQPGQNVENMRHAALEASRRGSQLLLLPELWTTGYDLEHARDHARANRALLPELARTASDLNLTLGGSLLLEENARIYNSFIFQPPAGPATTYAKTHLFRLMREDHFLTAGPTLQIAASPWGKTGLAICYDLRFPEMFRQYALQDALLFLISAEWPSARVEHWSTLLRARAIENQCFAAGVNCVGPSGEETFGGKSAIISPWGRTLAEGSQDEPALLTAEINLEEAKDARQRIPILQDRRPDLYD
jgi:predicted amidohydrolase